jgi:hypothetical protein
MEAHAYVKTKLEAKPYNLFEDLNQEEHFEASIIEISHQFKPHVNIYTKHEDRKSIVESGVQPNDYISFTFGFIILELY